MHEATFRLVGDSPFDEITAEYSASVSLWCNDHSDLLVIECPRASVEDVLERVDRFVGVSDSVVEGTRIVIATETCVKTHNMTAADTDLEGYDCLLLPPIRYRDGARLIRILALEPSKLTEYYRALLESFSVTVESKRELAVTDIGRSLSGEDPSTPSLSPRQREVFRCAVEGGYYEIPREISMTTVANRVGIDRRTADEHRRQAERKLLGSITL
ncbi:helix-turn-helix domain-containing protein [Halobacteria archaeon AArc-curdl1]|uniref:Helix-turn-helix domain-containing protein n=1 Tax=Natronosalvus hydrolyticus TaxID=2979988 RepID=A0AAP3E6Q8_9EURY|nr:helix-turn-helix domain-containing protein [Halobacteria archaeon AArc-curdl1]